MASSRLSLNNPDMIDVGAVMVAFEQMNECKITVLGRVESRDGQQTLCWLISALDQNEDLPDQRYLASVNVPVIGGGHRTIESAIMWALYKLDWELSEMKWGKNTTRAEPSPAPVA